MSETPGKTVKVKFEVEIQDVGDELHGRLMKLHEDDDLTNMVKSVLSEADAADSESYTRVIWGQWQQLG
ncbi:hypothetical protein [Stappia sp. ES.058]|uniref:hypothetical protein n=1 Tax=Stappia sp. ES.058 TaxID=1881061 RepID=UPI00087B9458|nr:hypothetical protein [Stappia sp. ES.058]SDU28866.1 hypothetical protein SAMN05428979_2762 [Stappia sp. ES.058]